MIRFRPRRRAVLAAMVLATALPFVSAVRPTQPAAAEPARAPSHVRITTAYELPGAKVYPEGITVDPYTGDLYAGSYEDGTIFRMTPGRRVAERFLPAGADGRTKALGLKVDRARRLWAIGADTGVAVYDLRSRRLLARFDVAGQDAHLVNDLAIAPDGSAYLTDSLRAVVYRVTPRRLAWVRRHGGHAPLTPAFDLSGVVEPHEPGTVTLNGIVADRSGRYLLVVDMTGGDLFRVDLFTRGVHKLSLDGGDLRYADGMELRHGTLWVAHADPTANSISRWRITRDGRSARAERRVTDQALQLPTTLVRTDGTLYVVRSQLDKGGPVGQGTPQTPFTIASVHGL
ncbi:SMP-30/gluconolactonase/LRE family protein [Microbispora triticiradicis]|uniref:SMP-30/gluconolactonase/LRE family protein n=1 Tax=Microbispora triticiradicis TaxID=2200763 RepID=UPI001AD6E38B|nr:SMP-30/gluconolactonase/LRE family protein [Microbispora triticiradicis]